MLIFRRLLLVVVVVVVVVVVTFGPYIKWRLSRPRLLSSCLRLVFKLFVLTATKQLGKPEHVVWLRTK